MALLAGTISVLGHRTTQWTGILERVFRDFAHAVQVDLGEKSLDALYAIPDRLANLAQSGVLAAVELQAGKDGISINLAQDPDVADNIDFSMLPLCDLRGEQVEVRLVVRDLEMANALGFGALAGTRSRRLNIRMCMAPIASVGQKKRGTARPSRSRYETPR